MDPYTNNQELKFEVFDSHLNLSTPDNHGGEYFIQLCGSASPMRLPSGCDHVNTGICHLHSGHSTAMVMVYANHTFSLVSHSPRVIDVLYHSGIACKGAGSGRNWSAIVQMVCSNKGESAVPVLASDSDCELRFVWRNQSFCAGESAARGCSAVDTSNNYVYSLDGLLTHNWTVSHKF